MPRADQPFGIGEIGLLESKVGFYSDAVGTATSLLSVIDTLLCPFGTAHHIDNCQRLDFLEAFGKKDERTMHRFQGCLLVGHSLVYQLIKQAAWRIVHRGDVFLTIFGKIKSGHSATFR